MNKNGFCLEKSVHPTLLSWGYPKSFQNEGWESLLAENAGDVQAGRRGGGVQKDAGLEGTDLNLDPGSATGCVVLGTTINLPVPQFPLL